MYGILYGEFLFQSCLLSCVICKLEVDWNVLLSLHLWTVTLGYCCRHRRRNCTILSLYNAYNFRDLCTAASLFLSDVLSPPLALSLSFVLLLLKSSLTHMACSLGLRGASQTLSRSPVETQVDEDGGGGRERENERQRNYCEKIGERGVFNSVNVFQKPRRGVNETGKSIRRKLAWWLSVWMCRRALGIRFGKTANEKTFCLLREKAQ